MNRRMLHEKLDCSGNRSSWRDCSFLWPALLRRGRYIRLIPSDGNVSGLPGSLVGWGYSLMNNDPSNWFMSTDLNADSFLNGPPTLLFDFPILAPGGSVTEAFDPVNSMGLFELPWDPSAPDGFVNSGNFTLSGQWFDGDP